MPVSVWSYLDLPGSLTERSAFFQFAAQYRIREVHLGASGPLSGALADFIQEAQERNIRVSLVVGKAAWVRPEQRGAALSRIRELRDFARTLREQGRVPPSGIHLDVEPHVLPDWGRDGTRLGGQYLDLLESIREELRAELPLAVDIPVWWDKRMIPRRGRVLPLSSWAIELADETILMDYRNRPSAILSSAEAELAAAEALGRKVVLGLAVHCDSDPDNASTSFCRKGHGALVQAMREVEDRLGNRRGYAGMAVFSYEDWRQLRP